MLVSHFSENLVEVVLVVAVDKSIMEYTKCFVTEEVENMRLKRIKCDK